MTHPFLSTLLFAWVLLSLVACNSSDQQEPSPQLESIGFAGTLPDDKTFGTDGILPSHSIVSSSSTVDGSYISYVFSILDPAEDISLMVELPYIRFNENYQVANDSIIREAVNKYYPSQVVKEKLSVGDKFILSSQHPNNINSFRIQMVDQKNYLSYTTEHHLDQSGSYLKIKQIIEDVETDPILGQVKKIDVLFDVDVKLYATDRPYNQPSHLKGLLRMQYLEK